jgi:hypothetical protein
MTIAHDESTQCCLHTTRPTLAVRAVVVQRRERVLLSLTSTTRSLPKLTGAQNTTHQHTLTHAAAAATLRNTRPPAVAADGCSEEGHRDVVVLQHESRGRAAAAHGRVRRWAAPPAKQEQHTVRRPFPPPRNSCDSKGQAQHRHTP